MLIQVVFVCACNHRFRQRQLSFRTAADADDLHTVNGLRAEATHIADGHARLTEAAAGNGEVVCRGVISTQFAVHHNLAAGRAGIVAVNDEVIAHAVVGCAQQNCAAIGNVAINGINA